MAFMVFFLAALCKDASSEFANVSQLMREHELSVTVKISAEYVQIMSLKKQPIFGIGSSCTNDVYHISEIKHIRCANLKKDIKQLSFSSTIDKINIKLRSVDAQEMFDVRRILPIQSPGETYFLIFFFVRQITAINAKSKRI